MTLWQTERAQILAYRARELTSYGDPMHPDPLMVLEAVQALHDAMIHLCISLSTDERLSGEVEPAGGWERDPASCLTARSCETERALRGPIGSD